jgi:hypothetical protein
MALFAYLGYYVEIRPYFEDNHRIWSVGFLDEVVVISTLFIIPMVYFKCKALRFSNPP